MKFATCLIALTCTLAPRAFAQCGPQWLPTLQSPDINSMPSSCVEWDPDGAGPQESVLVFAGPLIKAANLDVNGVVGWDGSKWFKLEGTQTFFGSPLSAPKLVVSGGTLYALDGNTLYHWMGSGWMPHFEIQGITRIAIFQGDLIAIGNLVFDPMAHKAARLHAGQWVPIDPPLSNSDQTYNDTIEFDGKLFCSGKFQFDGSPFTPWTSFISFDGTTWADGGALPLASSSPAQNLCVASGKLYAMQGAKIYLRDGDQWTLMPFSASGNAPMVEGLNGNLHYAVVQGRGLINQWDGASVQSAGNAALHPEGATPLALVRTRFGLVAWGLFQNRLTIYSGSSWAPIAEAFGGTINAFGRLNGQLIAGQGFKAYTNSDFVSPYPRIAKWDGLRFKSIGPAPHNPGLFGSPFAGINTLVNDGETVLVGGPFSVFKGAPAGGAMQILPTGEMQSLSPLLEFSSMSQAVSVFSFVRFQGQLHAMGRFDSSAGGVLGNIARLGESGWEWPDSGLTGVDGGGAYAAVVWNNELVVGGSFNLAGSTPVFNVARWNGSAWQPMGNPKGYVQALAIYSGELFAAGAFRDNNGNYLPLARWNGNDWQIIVGQQTGIGNALVEYQGNLIVGGEGASLLLNKWNGSTLTRFVTGGGPSGRIFALAVDHGELLLGGEITYFLGTRSDFFVRWSPDGIPWIAQQPEPASANCGRTLEFSAAPALGYIRYNKKQWRKNGVNLSNGITPSGSTIAGATTLSLSISNVNPTDSGDYDCVITTTTPTCPAVTTQSALATILCCPADFTGDLLVDDSDFQTFVVAYNALECPPVGPADLNHDNYVDDADFQLFVQAYNALICE